MAGLGRNDALGLEIGRTEMWKLWIVKLCLFKDLNKPKGSTMDEAQ